VLQKVQESYTYHPTQQIYLLFFFFQSLLQLLIAFVALTKLNIIIAFFLIILALPDLFNEYFYSKFVWSIWSDRAPFRKRFSYLTYIIQDRDAVKEIKIFQLGEQFLGKIK